MTVFLVLCCKWYGMVCHSSLTPFPCALVLRLIAAAFGCVSRRGPIVFYSFVSFMETLFCSLFCDHGLDFREMSYCEIIRACMLVAGSTMDTYDPVLYSKLYVISRALSTFEWKTCTCNLWLSVPSRLALLLFSGVRKYHGYAPGIIWSQLFFCFPPSRRFCCLFCDHGLDSGRWANVRIPSPSVHACVLRDLR